MNFSLLSARSSRLLIKTLFFLGLGASFASARIVTYQYYRFHPLQLQSSPDNVQLSEFQFFNGTAPVTGATVTDSANNSPAGEGPEKAFDGDINTKWLSRNYNTAYLIFDFGALTSIDRYNFITGNDTVGRDPLSWSLEGSADGESWEPVDVITGFAVNATRNAPAAPEPFIVPDGVTPVINTFEFFDFTQPSIVENGSSFDLYYKTLFADSATLTTDAGTPPVNLPDVEEGFTTIAPPSDRNTTYTLTATADGSVTKSLTVRSVPRQTQNYQYVRYTPVKLRGGAATIQLSDFRFFSAGAAVTVSSVTNPGGVSGATEGVGNLIDPLTTTKWLSSNLSPVIFNFGSAVAFDGYSFSTANDVADRDPVQWLLEGSNDNSTWTLIENVTGFDYPTTTVRTTDSGNLPIPGPGPSVAPVVTLTCDATFINRGQSVTLITRGESITLKYSTVGATSIAFTPAVGTSALSGSVTLTPQETTTYSLTATNAAGITTTRSVTVNVVVASGVIDYPQFESAPDMMLVGAAQILNDFADFPNSPNAKRLRLTDLTTNQAGSAWSLSKMKVSDGFETRFDTHIAFPVYVNGADGIAFTIQNNPAKYFAAPTSELEFSDKAVSIVLDSFPDRTGETQANLEVYVGTTRFAIYNLDQAGLKLARGYKGIYLVTQPTDAPYRVRIRYTPGVLSVYVDDVLVADRLAINLASVGATDADGKAFVGFSAKTRHIVAYHDVLNWTLTPGITAEPATLTITQSSFAFGTTPEVSLTFSSTSGKTYRITQSSDLAVWTPLGATVTATEASTTVIRAFAAGAKGFFRVEEVN